MEDYNNINSRLFHKLAYNEHFKKMYLVFATIKLLFTNHVYIIKNVQNIESQSKNMSNSYYFNQVIFNYGLFSNLRGEKKDR